MEIQVEVRIREITCPSSTVIGTYPLLQAELWQRSEDQGPKSHIPRQREA